MILGYLTITSLIVIVFAIYFLLFWYFSFKYEARAVKCLEELYMDPKVTDEMAEYAHNQFLNLRKYFILWIVPFYPFIKFFSKQKEIENKDVIESLYKMQSYNKFILNIYAMHLTRNSITCILTFAFMLISLAIVFIIGFMAALFDFQILNKKSAERLSRSFTSFML